MTNQEQVIAEIAREVVARLRTQLQQPVGFSNGKAASSISNSSARDGVFATVDEAVNAASIAQKHVAR